MRAALVACALGAPLLASIQGEKTSRAVADSPLLASIKVVEENTRAVADSLEAVYKAAAKEEADSQATVAQIAGKNGELAAQLAAAQATILKKDDKLAKLQAIVNGVQHEMKAAE